MKTVASLFTIPAVALLLAICVSCSKVSEGGMTMGWQKFSPRPGIECVMVYAEDTRSVDCYDVAE